MRALSIRQPYAELILRGVKKIEYRSRATKIIGERFYIYASKGKALGIRHSALVPSAQCQVPEPLPRGVIVGTAVISHVTNGGPFYEWHLTKVKRFRPQNMRKPKGRPQPVWFRPF
jgi:hypothetical protein